MTPDDLMGKPIWDAIRFGVDAARRAPQWAASGADAGPEPVRRAYERDRAEDVVDFCERAGIQGCTASLVRDAPLWVASVVYRFLVEERP